MSPVFSLPPEMHRQLGMLDPAAASRKTSQDDLAAIQARIVGSGFSRSMPDEALPTYPMTGLPLPPGPPRKSPVAFTKHMAVAAAVAAVAVIGVGSFVLSGRNGDSHLSTAQSTSRVAPAYEAALRATAPLAAGRSVMCGGLAVPAAVLAEPGGAENGSSEASAALRSFLADNPWRETSPVSSVNWLLLAQSNDLLVFGQRAGSIGVGAVVTFSKEGAKYRPAGLGGCGLVVPGADEHSATVTAATVHGTRLELSWMNSNCGGPGSQPDQVLVRTEIAQSDSEMHILIVTKDNPAAPNTKDNCQGVATSSTASVTLPGSLGSNTLHDDAHVPSHIVTVD